MSKHRKKRRPHPSAAKAAAALNPAVHPDAAGIDVGAEELMVAVPPGRGGGEPVRAFPTFTSGVYAMRDWLLACGITSAALESTGNYWVTTYLVLEEAGIEVCLVNARHVKGVPGRKSDVQDAQWLQQLHAAGLLRKSFRPVEEVAALRYLMRTRGELIQGSAQCVQHMQKVLTEMNLHIQHVFSDVDGVSAQRIISAILAGKRDPEELAKLRDGRCRTPLEKVVEALRGHYRDEYLFVLRQSQARWQRTQAEIAECDAEIARVAAAIRCAAPTSGPLPPPANPRQHSTRAKHALPILEEAWRFYGVDLSALPGVGSGLIATFMSELGTGEHIKAAFRSADAFASWLGLCPDNRVSGGKLLGAKTRKVVSRVAAALRMSAQTLGRGQDKLSEHCRRMKARLGKAEGITATAHKLARILYAMITKVQPYDEERAFRDTEATRGRRLRNLKKQAANLNLQLVPA